MGKPTGVRLWHRAVLETAGRTGDAGAMGIRDRVLVALPMFTIFGFGVVSGAVSVGATLVLEEEFHAREALRLVEAERDTVLHGVPTMFHLLMRETTFNPSRLRRLRGGTIAGGSVSEALEDRVRGWCDVDFAVRGPNVMPGCARMPAETRRSCTPEAFFLTGDLGIIDEDGNAAVDDVCVIGVPHNILGEPVCACIVPVDGVVMMGEEIKAFAHDTVAEYTTPSS